MTTTVSARIPFVDFIPLDVTDPSTFDWWCKSPAHDTRTLDEFAAEGVQPCPPPSPNRRLER